jgi:hypothetical protein
MKGYGWGELYLYAFLSSELSSHLLYLWVRAPCTHRIAACINLDIILDDFEETGAS